MTLQRVGVVGTGLIGTSIGLALVRRGVDVRLADATPDRAAAAAALGAGLATTKEELGACDHVVIAVPPSQVMPVLSALRDLDLRGTVSDVSSVKANLAVDVETLGPWAVQVCGGHPIAGRERGGPGAAVPELFEQAVWAVTPFRRTSAAAARDTAELARLCGAREVTVSPDEHDRVLAIVSHLPQVTASLLAALLPVGGDLAPTLAGSGFRDTTRLADSDATLWADIILSNAQHVAPALRSLARQLDAVADDAAAADRSAVAAALDAGSAARALLPGKAGSAAARQWAGVGAVLPDRPGELARLLTAAGAAGVNVEDLRIEHAADHPAGFVDLAVREADAGRLLAALAQAGWAAHQTR